MNTSSDSLKEMIKAGNDHEDAGRFFEALQIYRSAKSVFQMSHLPALNIGNVFFLLQDHIKAKESYMDSLNLQESAPALINMGNIEFKARNFGEAADWYSRAVRLQPDLRQAALGVAHARMAAGEYAAADAFIADWLTGKICDPEFLKLLVKCNGGDNIEKAFSHLHAIPDWDAECWLLAAKLHCSSLNPDKAFYAAVQSVRIQPDLEPARTLAYFTSMLTEAVTPNDLEELNKICFSRATAMPPSKRPNRLTGPIRVGYVSGDYKQHAAANYLYPIIKNHCANFTPIMISNTKSSDLITDQFKHLNAPFLDISKMDTATAKEAIRKLQIDILCDCSGHTTDNRLDLFDEYLSTLQVTFLGTALTTGAPAIDFRIVSTATDPREIAQLWNRERLAWLDAKGLYHQWVHREASTVSPCEHLGYVTIGFVNNQEKINLETLSDLREILAKTNARLKIIGIEHPNIKRLVTGYFHDHAERIEILGRVSIAEYHDTINKLDLAFDSYPYNGSTTTIDCLLSGIPVFSRIGERSHSRSSYAWLSAIEMTEMVFSCRQSRISAIIDSCKNPTRIISHRKTLARTVRKSSIMQPQVYMQKFEELLLDLLDKKKRHGHHW